MLNKVMLIGRLGKDPEIRYTQGGMPVANFNVATDENYTDREGNRQKVTEWFRVVVFDRQAENCQNYLSKGSLVYVEGALRTRKWQDQQGQDRYSTEVRAQKVQFLDRKSDRAYGGEEDYGAQGVQQPRAARSQNSGWDEPRQRPPRQSGQDNGWDDPLEQSRPAGNDYQQHGNGPAQKQQSPATPSAEEDMGPVYPSEVARMGNTPSMDEVPF